VGGPGHCPFGLWLQKHVAVAAAVVARSAGVVAAASGCHFYKRTGTCKFGKDCRFDHVDGGRSGASMMSKKTQKKMKNKTKDAVMHAGA
jgi:hypothetical protein